MDTTATDTATHGAATNLPGVFACGDAVDHRYRHGTGCSVALSDADSIATALIEEPTHA